MMPTPAISNRHLASARWALAGPRYELIPIKGLYEQVVDLPAGAQVTVTCSPKHGLERTLETGSWLLREGFRVVPHVAARLVRDRTHLRDLLQRLRAEGIGEIFLVGGDAPRPVGAYSDGVGLLRDLALMEDRPTKVGVPAYPESHGIIPDDAMRSALRTKAALADYMVTQICFDPARVAAWVREVRCAGITLPVFIGLAGVVETRRLLRIAASIGLGASSRLLRKQKGLIGQLMPGASYAPDALVHSLSACLAEPGLSVRGFHINTFNNVGPTIAWRDRLLEAIAREIGESDADTVAGGLASAPGAAG